MHHLIQEAIDYGGDGVADILITYHYDNATNLLQSKQLDKGVNGLIDELTLYIYDAFGNLISETVDRNDDGSIEVATFYDFDCWR